MSDIILKIGSDDQNRFIVNRSRLREVNSLSQITTAPQSIKYGSVANSGTAVISDYSETIKNKIANGEIETSNVDVSLYVDDNLIQEHISTDSDYDNTDKTFSINLSNRIKDLDTLKYQGYIYQDAPITVYVLLYDVLNNLYGGNLTETVYKQMLGNNMIHPVDRTQVKIWEYAQEVIIKFPSIGYGKTYREVLDELCTILQCYMFIDDNDNLVFETARPLVVVTDTSNAIRITKDKMYSPLKDAIIVKNKFDGIEISEQKTEVKTDINKAVQTWESNVSSHTTSSDDDEQSGTSSGSHYYNKVSATFWSGTIRIKKKSDDRLTTIDNIRTGEKDGGGAWIQHTVYYTHKTGTAGSGGII